MMCKGLPAYSPPGLTAIVRPPSKQFNLRDK
jgi:hypothetical protein